LDGSCILLQQPCRRQPLFGPICIFSASIHTTGDVFSSEMAGREGMAAAFSLASAIFHSFRARSIWWSSSFFFAAYFGMRKKRRHRNKFPVFITMNANDCPNTGKMYTKLSNYKADII
jgi:hypothetical protein